MADAAFLIPNFHGGEISAFAQGRADKPDYRVSLNVCLNSFPLEIGTWARRPGSRHGGHTRRGAAGRTIKFDFEQDDAVTLEFTDGWLRFRNGAVLLGGNDDEVVAAVSTADPAVVQTTSAVTWATGDTLTFPGESTPLLENRQFTATKVDTTHFSLADAITGDTIDGSTLGALVAGATVRRVQELVTAYVGGAWSGVRAVQAETTDILLCATVAPQALTVETLPADDVSAQFAIADAIFNDGPYLDPFSNGVQATPSAKTGIITLSLSFPAWSATKAYREGDFVTTGGVNYRSLADQNVNHAPGGGAPWWIAASPAEAINGGRGFLGTDIGRLVRLLSEPDAWAVGSTYSAGAVVSYNPSGKPGATTYWSSIAGSNTGNVPGADLTHWEIIASGAAIWSWGRITALSNIIDRALAGSASIGDMTSGGGLAAAFDGVFSQAASASAELSRSISGVSVLTSYVGKNYSAASDQAIQQATLYPSNDGGFAIAAGSTISITFNLRGKASLPASSSDGTLLGTSGTISNTFSAVTIVSTDQTTAWKYVWVEMIVIATPSEFGGTTMTSAIAELSLFNPPGTGTGSGVSVEVLGPPLLYTTSIPTWRLGVFSATTGYPTCGTYYEGRLWLGGAVANRFDASVSNGIEGGMVNFAPTDQNGAVAADNAISYTLNSDSANPMFWMQGEEKGITIGTQAGEFLVVAPTAGPLAPTNIAARRVTRHGCANIEPRRTEHTLVFVKRYARKLLEFFSDANFGKFSAPNLADKAGHIVSAGIAEIAYTEAVTPVIWGRDANNALFGVTYKRDTLTTSQPPTFAAWHRHTLGSGRTIESICNGPSAGGDLDTLTLVTNDSDSGIRHVEILTDTPDENAELADSWFLDNAVTPTSYTISSAITNNYPYGSITLNGLWHLNGETVQVFAAGLDCGDRGRGTTGFTDFTVADGSLTIPFGDSISSGPGRGLFTADFVAGVDITQIVVGFTYNSDGQLVRPLAMADTGARNGPALGKTRRMQRYAALVSTTRGISFGTEFAAANLKSADLRQANGNQIADLTMFSGVHSDALTSDHSYDGMVCWRVSRPWPANLVAFEAFLQTQDR